MTRLTSSTDKPQFEKTSRLGDLTELLVAFGSLVHSKSDQ